MEKRECRKCLLLESGDKNNHETVVAYINKIKPEEKCDDETYIKRLEICKNCDNLLSGTCLKCGCYVEFRAAFKNKKCPDTKTKKW